MIIPSGTPKSVGYWRTVREWCMGGNDEFGTCFFAMFGNLHVIVTNESGNAEVMSNGEIEYADSVMTGFTPLDALTDKGIALVTGFQYLQAHGWPGDPEVKPTWWREIQFNEIHQAIFHFGAVPSWVMLPIEQGGDVDFTDNAMGRIEGTGPHAVLLVGSTPGRLQLVSWARIYDVSLDWWAAYGKQAFAVLHPDWTPPKGSIFT